VNDSDNKEMKKDTQMTLGMACCSLSLNICPHGIGDRIATWPISCIEHMTNYRYEGMTATYQDSIHKEINLNLGTAGCHLVHKLLSSLPYKKYRD
jgi:hypothetical protein